MPWSAEPSTRAGCSAEAGLGEGTRLPGSPLPTWASGKVAHQIPWEDSASTRGPAEPPPPTPGKGQTPGETQRPGKPPPPEAQGPPKWGLPAHRGPAGQPRLGGLPRPVPGESPSLALPVRSAVTREAQPLCPRPVPFSLLPSEPRKCLPASLPNPSLHILMHLEDSSLLAYIHSLKPQLLSGV